MAEKSFIALVPYQEPAPQVEASQLADQSRKSHLVVSIIKLVNAIM
jgi:hypothetical protein